MFLMPLGIVIQLTLQRYYKNCTYANFNGKFLKVLKFFRYLWWMNIAKWCYFVGICDINNFFFKNIWSIQKKAVPLQSLLKIKHFRQTVFIALRCGEGWVSG